MLDGMSDLENVIKSIGCVGGDIYTSKKGKLQILIKQHDGTEVERFFIL